MRVTLIHNPTAGDDSQPGRGRLQELIESAGHQVRYQSLAAKGWSKVLEERADVIAVAGGDGTVGKVARRSIGRGLPIAVLPTGTANNVSRTLGIADMQLSELIPSWESARRLAFDAGIARAPWASRHFIEGAGCGLFSEAMAAGDSDGADAANAGPQLRRDVRTLRERLPEFRPVEVTASLDGRDISGSYLLFEALLMRFIGPNLPLASRAEADDGRFDVVMIGEAHREELREHLAAWETGTLTPAAFPTKRGALLRIGWTGFPMHVDDSVWPDAAKAGRRAASIEITIERRAIEFLVPQDVSRNGR